MTTVVTGGRMGAVGRRRDRAQPTVPPSTFDLDEAWRAHGGALYGYAVNSLGDRHAAEDCVQETFVRAWRARERFAASRGSMRTWLFAIARHVVVDAARARARRPVPVDQAPEVATAPVGESAPEHVVDRLALVEAMARLSREHREVLVAVRLHGMTYAELADATGVPVATLRTRAYHALRALRAALEEDHDG